MYYVYTEYKKILWRRDATLLLLLEKISVFHDQWTPSRSDEQRENVKFKTLRLYNNNKRDRRRWHFLNINNTFFRPKNVDSLCRFHVPFFSSSFQKIPSFPTGFECLQFLHTFLGNLFCRFRNLRPPFFKKKKKGPPSIAEDLIRYVDDCVTMYLIAATIGGINLKKNVHTQLLLLDTYSVPF